MKIYVLCSYDGSLNDPTVKTDYDEAFNQMSESYHLALDGITQTDEEKEYTYFDGYSARAVIHGDWIEWTITELDIPLPAASSSFIDEKSHAQKTLIETMPKNPYLLSYFLHKGLTPGNYYIAADYIIWIDQKHDEFRKLHNLPECLELNDAEAKEFLLFLNQDLEKKSKGKV